MEVKAAVKIAKEHLLDLFADEDISNLGLEEVEFDDSAQEWVVTLGFSRPWDEPRNAIASLAQAVISQRSYKTLRISDSADQVISVKNHEVSS
jgi:hypothetical protein